MVFLAVIKRLEILSSVDLWTTKPSASQLVEDFCCDPISVFIKNEPHTLKKIEENRERLIFNVSMIDEIIERLLSMPQIRSEIDNWNNCPSTPGISLNDHEATSSFVNKIINKTSSGKAADNDTKGFDVSVTAEMAFHEAKTKCALAGSPPDHIFSKIMMNRYYCLMLKMVVLSDGSVLIQRIPGWWPSGSFWTASSDSRIRVTGAYRIGAEWAFANGDDCVEQFIKDAVAKYLAIGLVVTDYTSRPEGFEFCSHDFYYSDGYAIPKNIVKSLYRLLSNSSKDLETRLTLISQFLSEYKLSPDINSAIDCIRHVWDDVPNFSKEGVIYQSDFGMIKKLKNIEAKVKSIDRKYNNAKGKVVKIVKVAKRAKKAYSSAVTGDPVGFIKAITGKGDYYVSSNTLGTRGTALSSDAVPAFRGSSRGVRVSHREYLGEVVASPNAGAFSNTSYSINPGLFYTFPWFSAFANQFDLWKPLGVVFCFKSESSEFGNASATLGTVIMASDYDVLDPPYASKIEMENSQWAVSAACTTNLLHPVECDVRRRSQEMLYTRSGAPPATDSLRWYDLANFQVATVGCAANQVVGELWVTFDILLDRTQIFSGVAGKAILNQGYSSSVGVTFVNLFGTASTPLAGNLSSFLDFTTTPGRIIFSRRLIGGSFKLTYLMNGTTSGTNGNLTIISSDGYQTLPGAQIARFTSANPGVIVNPTPTTTVCELDFYLSETTVPGGSPYVNLSSAGGPTGTLTSRWSIIQINNNGSA